MKLVIPTIVRYIKYQHIINNIYKNEHIQQNFSNLFGVKFEKDWIGRLWTVINPYIQDINSDEIGSNGKNTSTTIFEYNEDGTMSNSLAIEKWIMDRMNIASEFIINNNLFELLSYRIEKIDADENYLFTIHNIVLEDLKDVLKPALKRLCWTIVIAVIALVVVNMIQ